LTPGTKLRELIGSESIRVNTFHHQSIKDVGKGYQVSAVAADGTVEAIENTSKRWVLAVQFHIEYLWRTCPEMERIFTRFVEESSKS
jgi:putative glutamine amidotransferase